LIAIPLRILKTIVFLLVVYLAAVTWIYFPRDTGLVELPPVESDVETTNYYNNIYRGAESNEGGEAEGNAEHIYVPMNRAASKSSGIEDSVTGFVEQFGLQGARTLEVGAGSGVLQDIVDDYTGLDIAENAARYFHKPFVQGSATELPFEDNSFDAAWTVWTLEHVPNPEKAMQELRRVVKPGGMLYFFPAWNCLSWAATGYGVRPFNTLTFSEKLEKASLQIRGRPWFRTSYLAPIRLLRYGYWKLTGKRTRLRYRALAPNYTTYWEADADAIAAIDPIEAMVWFTSRGDECLNCPDSLMGLATIRHEPLFIRVRK
jgi:SAM-dependent methyltransferase